MTSARFFAASLFLALSAAVRGDVIIDEIMYHPSSELTTEEYIELYNTGASSVDLSGWKFTNGVSYTFPVGTSILAGDYLVVTANPAVFHAKYPAVTKYVASTGWQTLPNSGILSNSANKVVLADNLNVTRDTVSYADDGEWAVRVQDIVADFGHKGWSWDSAADGFGKSLELINVLLDNNLGQNWRPSAAVNGTPGAANSIAASNTAPFILGVSQFPFVPTSSEQVAVTAQIVSTLPGNTVNVHYRNDGAAGFTSAAMFDDGTHGDALANDGIYGAFLPAQPNNTIVEFYVQATDSGARTRTWPAPALNASLVSGQFCNCLYQVDDTVFAGAMPFYKMIMRAVDKAELTQINTNTPAAPFATTDQTESHARMNATWITSDGTSKELRYLAGVRNRGHGSRSRQPQSFNVSFENDVTWKGVVSLNLNTQQTHSQLFGSALFRAAGLASPDSRQAQLRVNNVDPTGGGGSPDFGFYCANEVQNSDFTNHHYPLDSSGNLYRSQRLDSNAQQGDFSYIDNNPVSYQPVWFKHTNSSENDWSDLIALCLACSKGHSDASFNTTYDAGYEAGLQAHANVRQWMRFFAVETIVDNSETNISNGYGDDFYVYFGITDPRAHLVPYDLDTICGQGDSVPTPTQHGLFRAVNQDDASGNGPSVMNSVIKNPTFAPIYYDELNKQLNGAFTTANFNALVDEILNGVVPSAQLASIKTFQSVRTPYIAGLIPLTISVTNTQTVAGAALPMQNGYAISIAPNASTTPPSVVNADPAHGKLIGKANAITTRSVKVNGVAATWSAWQATWTAASVTLTPGINKVLVQAFDGSGAETERFTEEIWYNDGSIATAGGSLAASTTWTAAGGPYQITAALTVPSGVTLTIQPGTSVYVAAGVNITVANGGRILAEGNDTQRIRFTKTPGSTNWGGLTINGAAGSPETRIAYADFEFNGGSPCILCTSATVYLDHLTFANTALSYLHLDGSSFIVSNCIFPTATAAFELVHGTGGVKAGGYGIVRDCFFGSAIGYNDIFDFTGGSRPSQALIQFYNNVFIGGSDDMLDLDGTDAWVEGNIFLHCHKNGSPDTSSAVSGGQDQGDASAKSEITIIGNIFYDCDNAMTAKEGNFYTLINNTIVHQNRTGGTEARAGVVNLADDGIPQGAGTYLTGNIIYDAEALERSYTPLLTSIVTFNNNILPFAWTGAGSGNSVVDPRFKHVPTSAETNFGTFEQAQIMRDWLSLLPGSPAIGTGPNGRDKGGVIPRGASVSGEPNGTTNQVTATLTVGANVSGFGIPTVPWPNGSGFTHYQWKLDNGAFSAETPIGTPISLAGLANGTHTVFVIGKNDIGLYQNDPKLGADALVSSSKPWTVNTAYVPPAAAPNVVINEVLAKNSETIGFSGVFPDIIELRNTGGAPADLSGWGLTDNTTLPYKYTFPNGTTLNAGAYLVIYADSAAAVPAPKTGFGLKQAGDTLTLTKSVAAGGSVADATPFGAQLPDYSIGRRPSDGQWDMCLPTFGAVNVVAAQEKPARVLINEWLADAQILADSDFIELYNPSALPVNVGGCFLTNNPVEYVTQHQFRQLTFIAPAGYVSFKADNDPGQGPDHLALKLSPLQGEIGFFDSAQNIIDRIIYGPQSTDVSQGRTPNGAITLGFFNQPTPGGPNPGSSNGSGTSVVSLIPATQSWKYFAGVSAAPPNDASSRAWTQPLFTDTAWTSAVQLLYIENAALTNAEGFAKTTVLPGLTTTKPYQTYYFRTHFSYSGPLTGVTLTLTTMLDDGCVLYLNGTEVVPTTGNRIGMPAGAVVWATLANRTAGDAVVETFTLPASQLVVGDNVLAVEVHQNDLQSSATVSSDIVWGAKLAANVPVAGSSTTIVINEVLANNASFTTPDGSFSGWIELYNTSASAVNVADMSLTDDTADARKWVFPAGSSVPANGYLVVFCNPLLAASTTNVANMNAGFGLNAAGDRIFLFKKLADGSGLQDSVVFGQQVPDRSIGRIANGAGGFALNVATRGASNTAAGLGAISTVKINEWLAAPTIAPGWFELFNSGAAPVLLSGNYLTDNLTNRIKYLIPPLTFIGGTGNAGNSRWLQLFADNDNGATPNHVNFTLNSAGEAIGIFSGSGVQLESISFGLQTSGVSGGRFPDGSASIQTLTPTPNAANVPAAADTDGDGIPDAWEIANGLNPNDPLDAALDRDGDGKSNLAEYLAGTDPNNPLSVLTSSIAKSAGQTVIRFTAAANKSYTIQFKNTLLDLAWQKLTDIAADPAVRSLEIPDPVAGGFPARFYRVVTPLQP